MNRIKVWIVAGVALVVAAAGFGREVTGYDSEAEVTESMAYGGEAGRTLSSDPEW